MVVDARAIIVAGALIAALGAAVVAFLVSSQRVAPGPSATVPAAQPAQPAQPAPAQTQPSPVQAAAAAAQPTTTGQSDADVIVMLVRSIFAAVHQANLTGNYSVLRDLGTPAFQGRNSAADLAGIFAPIRNAKIDLGSAVLVSPQMAKAALNQQKELHLAGTVATRPVETAFELLLQPIDGQWRIQGIAIVPVQPRQPAAPAKPKSK